MSTDLRLISSMATRQLLGALTAAWSRHAGRSVELVSVGGVDAARRVAAGEAFDAVVLAADALEALNAAGHLCPGSVRALVDSPVAIAVPAGADRPDVGSAAALRDTLCRTQSIGYSTGPSGTALLKLIDHWGLGEQLRDRLVQARPGLPVGELVAQGQVQIGFQQLSELRGMPGITLLGGMPKGLDIISRFSGAVTARAADPVAAQALLDHLAAPDMDELKRQHGMTPIRPEPHTMQDC